MTKSISILLGAGFSAPLGYPVGNKLNDLLLGCTGEDFVFHTGGTLAQNIDGTKPDLGFKNSYDFEFDFCRDLMQYFNKEHGYFDYEEFYDFFTYQAKDDPNVKLLFESKTYGSHKDLDQMIYGLRNIYSQLIGYYLKDKEGKKWYEDAAYYLKPSFSGYTGILNCVSKLAEKHLINVHTLNHDLFFERLNNTEWLAGELCDGFEELGSPYYGKLVANNTSYMVRLKYYTGKYDKKYRLYKLHGSRDYGIYYGSKGSTMTPQIYLKTRCGIGFGKLYKEICDPKKNLSYENCWINYHADFLTGTTSKIERYAEPLLYKKLFEHFRSNLKEAEKLIIIGYGAKDSEINKMILENFDFKHKPVFIIDPFPGEKVNEIAEILNAVIITKHLENISLTDLNIA